MNRKFYQSALFVHVACLVFFNGLIIAYGLPDILLGFMSVFWGILTVSILLWLTERTYYYKKTKSLNNPKLPVRLLKDMEQNTSYNQSMHAFKAFHPVTFCMGTSLFMYVLWSFWNNSYPLYSEDFESLSSQVHDYFHLMGIKYVETTRYISLIQFLAPLLLVSVVYVLTQIFVYSAKSGQSILWISLVLFLFGFLFLVGSVHTASGYGIPYHNWFGYGWDRKLVLENMGVLDDTGLSFFQERFYETGIPGIILFYVPGACLLFFLIWKYFGNEAQKNQMLTGIIILAIMFFVDQTYVENERAFSFWLSGWVCLAALSVPERIGKRKIYRIHQ